MASFTRADEKFMARAVELARHGVPYASPNPFVGCVLVKGGRIVGEGWHARFGGAHAEPMALAQAGARAKGATAYVTMEPCCAHGSKKTPPCAPRLIEAGVKRVVAAIGDPNRRVCGRGLRQLRAAGLDVSVGLLARDVARLNRPFFVRMRLGRPYVILKAAASLDGRVATSGGESQWITSPDARREGWRLRASVDAILVGAGTIAADDPELTAHGEGRDPMRVVLDSRLRLRSSARVLKVPGRTVVFTRASGRGPRGAEVEHVAGRGERLDIAVVLRRLAAMGVGTVVVEGGSGVQTSFLESGLVDEVRLFLAPKLIGGEGAPGFFEGAGARRLKDALTLHETEVRRVGPDLLVSGVIGRAARVF